MTKEEFLTRIKEDENYSPGWQAIDDAFEKLYPGQEPKHFGTSLPSRAMFGGDEYLDGLFFVKHFSLKKALKFPVFSKGISLLSAG